MGQSTVCGGIGRLDEMTKQTVRCALAISNGNVSEAPRRLGINRSTVYRRLLDETTSDRASRALLGFRVRGRDFRSVRAPPVLGSLLV